MGACPHLSYSSTSPFSGRCVRDTPILFHLLVPGGRWWTAISMPSSLASLCNSRFHSRTREALLPPPSLCLGIALAADIVPPATYLLHGECGGVIVHTDTDPAGVSGQIVDTIRHRPR